ncbi:hypothetical protein BASA81_002434 [Batrachochytrium salamandrivorans]|nr:hypothetical protein BASA81_002434 [Batrachochytrium salamandrivorans]
MCKGCVRDCFPERGRSVLESGFYHINFASCVGCGERSQSLFQGKDAKPQVLQGDDNDNDGEDTYEETIEFEHQCDKCKHVIAQHYYQFKILPSGQQEYVMSCSLCGKGEDLGSAWGNANTAGDRSQLATQVIPPTEIFAGLKLSTMHHHADKPEGQEEEEEWN